MIEGIGPDTGSARRVRAARRRRRRGLWAILALALLAAAALFGRRLLEGDGLPVEGDEGALPEATAPGEAPLAALQEPPAPLAEPVPGEALPSLADSDPFVRERASAASAMPEFAVWLAGEGLVTRFVAAVDNVANGESPRDNLGELAPRAPFQAIERSGRHFATPRSWSRYELVARVFGSLDADVCARLHGLLLPLFEQAYGELGRREGKFDDVLSRAFRELLATPVRDGESELVPGIRSYRFADRRLELLSPAQKHLLRMGPSNARAIQAKLQEIAGALELDVEGTNLASPAP
jgi:DUF3014 family protein